MGSSLRNGDTAVLPVGYVRSGLFGNSIAYASRNNDSYFQKRTVENSERSMILIFHNNMLYLSNGNLKGTGGAVPQESFAKLLSESYGLAEGRGTNRDTAVLSFPIEFPRAGAFYPWGMERGGNGFFWQTFVSGKERAHNLWFTDVNLNILTNIDVKHSGRSVGA